ncbi:MAG: beta-galactosidase [Rikenellaceae bacterium]
MKKILLCCLSALCVASVSADNIEKSCEQKISRLESLIKKAKAKNLDTQREECAIFMSELFLKFANWDQANIDLNEHQYSMWAPYKADARQYALDLPDFQRSEVEAMLDTAIAEISGVISGDIVRPEVPQIDWTSVKLEGGQFVSNGHPVYINHFNRVPAKTSNAYTGVMDRIPLGINMLANMEGELTESAVNSVINKKEGNSGFVFVGHSTPAWLKELDPDVEVGNRLFTSYDIDNPLVRELWAKTTEKVVPHIKGRRSADQGYMLSNEPHWIIQKDAWATGVVSKHTMAKFRAWLEEKHKDIARLNQLWGTSYSDFSQVDVEIPFDSDIFGLPMAYDIQKFNQDRVTDWFKFLNDNIKRYDPSAKTHIKVMPDLFVKDERDNGLDFEQLTLMSDIIGNDSKIAGRLLKNKYSEKWEPYYCFNWEEVGLAYDFMESVKPDMTNINTESHFLSASQYRDIALSKEFTRAAYWLATLQGMSISYTWFWPREDDGAIPQSLRAGAFHTDNAMPKSYVASVIQQPRVANEVAKTYMDMNSIAEEMAALQSLRRPMRIFYSETTAINKTDYMESISDLYNAIYFEGNAVGFATENIIKSQENSSWGVILVRKTNFVTDDEFNAVQQYLDHGGVVIIDNESLKLNEYGEPRSQSLEESKGTLIRLLSIEQFVEQGVEVLESKGSMPKINIAEANSTGRKGCVWRVIPSCDDDGCYVVNILNIGCSEATLTITNDDGSYVTALTDMFTGKGLPDKLTVEPFDVLMIKVKR